MVNLILCSRQVSLLSIAILISLLFAGATALVHAETATPVLDHFEFDTIGNPQTTGVEFNIRMTAKDQYGATFTGYSGAGTLSDFTGISTSVYFMNGISDASVNIAIAYTGNKITVNSGGKSGTSNIFNIVEESRSEFPTEFIIIAAVIVIALVIGVVGYKKVLKRPKKVPALARYPRSSTPT
jgi:hypothetical protein